MAVHPFRLCILVSCTFVMTACTAIDPTLTSTLNSIFTVPISGGAATQVIPLPDVTGDGHFQHPRWSPDDSQIVVANTSDGEIYIASATGTSITNISNTSSLTESAPEWAPSGTTIAYIGVNSSGLSGLYTMSSTGQNQTALMTGITEFGWSPDGSLLWGIGANRRLYLITPGGSITGIGSSTPVDTSTTPEWAGPAVVQFKSNGVTYLATTSDTVAIQNTSDSSWNIPTATVFTEDDNGVSKGYWVGSNKTIISLGSADLVSLSPDGTRLALARNGVVYTTTPGTLTRTEVLDTAGASIQSLTWCSDNNTIVIAGTSGIIATSFDGNTTATLSTIGSGDFDISDDGSTLVYTGVREETL